MAKQRGRESNTGLVVTLVFFIILSVGLGVATYYGFAQQTALTTEKTTAVAGEKDMKAQRDWYQFQAWTYRTYLGQTEGFDKALDAADKSATPTTVDTTLKVYRDQYDLGQMGKDSKGEFPDRATVANVIKKIESAKYEVAVPTEDKATKTKIWTLQNKTMAWDKETKRPKFTFEDVYTGLLNLRAYFDQQIGAALSAKNEAEAAKTTSDMEKAKAQADYAKEIVAAAMKNAADLAAAQKTIDETQGQLAAAKKSDADLLQAEADKGNKIAAGVAAKDKIIAELDAKIKDMRERLDQNALRDTDATPNGRAMPISWKIVKMDRTGKEPFINLGRADNVRPPLTFSIHGRGPDGKPLPASKGTLEVVNVVNDHLAQAQIVSVKDAQKDPILEGDYLYNPVFHPGAPQHVVIAGRIDMHGVKDQDDMKEFERLLQRQNVVVDGYVDLQDASVKGKLSSATDLLILGDEAGAKPEVGASIKQLKDQARSNGVRVMSARDFLESIGYRKS
jgi:hypothetical protein